MAKKIRLAAVQMNILQAQPKKNLAKVEYFLNKIGKNNVDLVVFPEDCTFGWIEAKAKYHQSIPGNIINIYRKFAYRFNTYIVAGSFTEKHNNKRYNTSILIDNKGKILLIYRKIYLWGNERKYLSRGLTCPVVKTKLGNIGIMICWDLAFPEIGRTLFKKGVQIICCPSFWCEEDNKFYGKKYLHSTEASFIDAGIVARAYENECCVIYSGGAGIFKFMGKEYHHVGHTQIALPNLGVVAKLNHNKEGIITYNLDLRVLKDAEKAYEIKKDWRQKIN